MIKSSKHTTLEVINLYDFSGGLNHSLPPDLIASNECIVMKNIVIDPQSALATSRPTFEKVIDIADIRGIHFSNYPIVVAGSKVYHLQADTPAEIGNITANSAPTFADWDGGVIIATGESTLYFAKDGAIETITPKSATNVDIKPTNVFTRHGRVVLYNKTTSTLHYSNVGELAWNYNDSIASNAKFIEVGYKDSGNIVAVANLATDIIVFKSSGLIYRLVGEYPAWSVSEVARNITCLEQSSLQLKNSCLFMTNNGLLSLETVDKYGDIQLSANLSRKVDPVLTRALSSSAPISYLPSLQAIFINTTPVGENYVMNVATNAFTTWQLPFNVRQVCEYKGAIYIASDDAIYKSNTNGYEQGEDLKATITTKTFSSNERLLIKEVCAHVNSNSNGKLRLKVGKLEYDLQAYIIPIAKLDTSNAYMNISHLVNNEWQSFNFKDAHSYKNVSALIELYRNISSKIELHTITIGDK